MSLTDLSSRNVLVGGGCGFFGSYLVPALVRSGANVTVVDNLANGELAALDPVRADIRFIEQDLRDRAACDELLRQVDLFVNLAGSAYGVGYSRGNHADMLVDNVLCGLVPLQAAARHRVPHVVLTSTSCVYPDAAPVPTPELDAFTGAPEHVNQGYGWAKRIQELAGGYFACERGMKVTVLRPFNLYGANYPWRSDEKAHVIPSLVKRVLDGENPLVVWGSGEQRRNFLHGTDAAELTLRVIGSGAEGPVNLGYESDTSIAELADLICEVTGRFPTILFDRNRPDGQARKSADATRLRSLTGDYTPRVTLREGIQEMVAWYYATFAV